MGYGFVSEYDRGNAGDDGFEVFEGFGVCECVKDGLEFRLDFEKLLFCRSV